MQFATMALKSFFCISFVFFLLPILSIQALPSIGTNLSPFEFLQQLKGCHKGETMEGLSNLKQYLKRFGYLDQAESDNDEFDDSLESAIKTYQVNYHLKSTGTLDTETVSKMSMPRCGVPDIINGTTAMLSGNKQGHDHSSSSPFHTVAHYSFFPNNPKWPDSKTHLTWAIDTSGRKEVLSPPLTRAFVRWSSVSRFTFEEIQNYTVSDIRIGVYSGDHSDGYPFDGPNGTLAHAFPPTNGMFHYDADEPWVDGVFVDSFDLQTVALHEIGHLLGLGHSSVEGAIMYPTIAPGFRGDLQEDDIQGIKALYNL